MTLTLAVSRGLRADTLGQECQKAGEMYPKARLPKIFLAGFVSVYRPAKGHRMAFHAWNFNDKFIIFLVYYWRAIL